MVKQKKYPCKNTNTSIYEKLFGGDWWAEWQFHPVRKWRFDYALPELKIAIEIDGGIFVRGRHTRGAGQLKDMEKMNSAAALGWTILHFVPKDMFSEQARYFINECIKLRQKEEK